MAKECSFDIVSQGDMNEVRNAVNMAQKEIATRYDFKKSVSSVTLEGEALVLVSDNEGKLAQVVELLEEKLVRRKVPLKALQYGKIEEALGGTVRQRVADDQRHPRREGEGDEQAPAPALQEGQGQIQGDTVRVFSRARTNSRRPWRALRDEDWGIPLQFVELPLRPRSRAAPASSSRRSAAPRTRPTPTRSARRLRAAGHHGVRRGARRRRRRQHLRLHRRRQGGVDRGDPRGRRRPRTRAARASRPSAASSSATATSWPASCPRSTSGAASTRRRCSRRSPRPGGGGRRRRRGRRRRCPCRAGRGPCSAYVKVSDGCDRRCAFCAIPLIKGDYETVPPAEVLARRARGARRRCARARARRPGHLALGAARAGAGSSACSASSPRSSPPRVAAPALPPAGGRRRRASGGACGARRALRRRSLQHASGAVLRRMGRAGDGAAHLAPAGAGPRRAARRRGALDLHRRVPRRDRSRVRGARSPSCARPASPSPASSSTTSRRARPPPACPAPVPRSWRLERAASLGEVIDREADAVLAGLAGQPRRRARRARERRAPTAARSDAAPCRRRTSTAARSCAAPRVRRGDLVRAVVARQPRV